MLSGLSLLEIKDLQKVIENFHLIQIANFCGHDYLFDNEKDIVEDILGRGSFFIPYIEQYYKLGVLRTTNPLQSIDNVDWKIMENFLSQESKVIKLTTKEKGILSSIKTKNYSHIKGLSNYTINHLNNVIYQQQHKIIKSEEHTSELQSHSDLVCRLLLEKKNQNYNTTASDINTQLRYSKLQ